MEEVVVSSWIPNERRSKKDLRLKNLDACKDSSLLAFHNV